jgi:cell division protein FtsX
MAIALVGCGGNGRHEAACAVKVFFDPDATPAQIQAVREQLEADPRVARVNFVSKEEALAMMRRQFPDLVKDLPVNPLPASIQATPREEGESAAIASDLSSKKPGVEVVRDGCAARRSASYRKDH